MLRFYAPASTANPTGRRPWNSRLSFYERNSYAVPTIGQGPWLLNPGVVGAPAANGGLGWYQRAEYPLPTTSMSGLGQTQILGLTVDPTLLALGIAALLGAVYLFGGKRPQRKTRRLRRRITRAQRELQAMAA